MKADIEDQRLMWPARLAWGLTAATVVLLVLGIYLQQAFDIPDQQNVLEKLGLLIGFTAFPFVGALIASRHPRNALAWIYVMTGFMIAVLLAAAAYAHIGLVARPGNWPFVTLAAWMEAWMWFPPLVWIMTLGLLLFPTGSPPSRRWRWLMWASIVLTVLIAAGSMFQDRLASDGYDIDNPVGILDFASGEEALGPLFLLTLVFSFLSAASLIVRYRRAVTVERQQLKLLLVAAIILVAGIFLGDALQIGFALPLTLWMIPAAVGASILKYRLYDIDVVINRALVYGLLTGILAGGYLGMVALLQLALEPFTPQSDISIVISTLAVAAVFRPLRRRVQSFIDRRFYRNRYDSAATLENFAARLRDEVDLGSLSTELVTVVGETMRPAHASLWLRSGG